MQKKEKFARRRKKVLMRGNYKNIADIVKVIQGSAGRRCWHQNYFGGSLHVVSIDSRGWWIASLTCDISKMMKFSTALLLWYCWDHSWSNELLKTPDMRFTVVAAFEDIIGERHRSLVTTQGRHKTDYIADVDVKWKTLTHKTMYVLAGKILKAVWISIWNDSQNDVCISRKDVESRLNLDMKSSNEGRKYVSVQKRKKVACYW